MRVKFKGQIAVSLNSPTTATMYEVTPGEIFEATRDDAVAFVANGVCEYAPVESGDEPESPVTNELGLDKSPSGDELDNDTSTDDGNDTSFASMTREELELELGKVGATVDDIEGTGKEGFVKKDDIVAFLTDLHSA